MGAEEILGLIGGLATLFTLIWKAAEYIGYKRENKNLREINEKLVKIIEKKMQENY